MSTFDHPPLGALATAEGVQFRCWAPAASGVDLVLEDESRTLSMHTAGDGYYERLVPEAGPGARYRYRLDGGAALPDPASRYQPDGVHGPSAIVDPDAYAWSDATWSGHPREDLVFYELHVGTFSPEGTFDGVRERLPHLKDLGITAVELLPVADFPGRRNWGYDGATLYAPARAYGAPDDLRALVDAAHHEGLAIFLDVVYNHLGPDGAYAAVFMPMFTNRHHTPWGRAVNLDDTGSAGVRRFFIDNALMWLHEYHMDGLRLDATFALHDESVPHFLRELVEAVQGLDGPPRHLIAEDHRNLNVLVRSLDESGYGLDGVWIDDFHHQMRNLTAGDHAGYFEDFAETTASDVAKTLRDGWFFQGHVSKVFGHRRGEPPEDIPAEQCVFYLQNHDQVGNRPTGARLIDAVSPAMYRAATALLLFVPQLPLLFMGQEWAASTPFQYFTDHEPELGRQVREGRKEEFDGFPGFSAPDKSGNSLRSFQGEVPDPQASSTFQRSKLDWSERDEGLHARTLAFHHALLALRPTLGGPFDARAHGDRALVLQRGPHRLLVAFAEDLTLPLPEDAEIVLHTEEPAYTAAPQPPHIEDGQVRFLRAGALIAKPPFPLASSPFPQK